MSDIGETRPQRIRRNVIAGAIAGALVLGAAIGVPAAVNASNTHQQEVAQTLAAKNSTVIVRADGQRDAMLVASATQAGVIAQQEAAAKAAALAAQQAAAAAAAQAAAAAAQKAAQQQQESAMQPSNTTSNTTTSASTTQGLPAGSPVPWISDPNAAGGGRWDTTKCASGRASTGSDGKQYCV